MNEIPTSLYKYIASKIVDGQLPDDFSLPKEKKDNEITWMDGAQDGVRIYHMGYSDLTEEDRALMEEAVNAASEKNTDKADVLFSKLGQSTSAIAVIDDLQPYIIENKDTLSIENLFHYAAHLVFDSYDKECVKFGLSLLELFHFEEDETLKEVVRTLGMSDEFSIFSIFVMSNWQNGNYEIFQLAKKIHGWGRIHAIEHIEPDSNEIKQWLLREGVHNRVLSAYSALTCWQKSDALNILQGKLSREDFSGIRDIIDGLLDEGPVSGISEIENSADVIVAFLNQSKTITLTLDDYETIHTIWMHFESEECKNNTIIDLCQNILGEKNCRELVSQAVKEGKSLRLAQALQIDYREDILQILKTSFQNNYYLCSYITNDAKYRAEVLQIFAQNLPLDAMKTAPSDSLGLGSEYIQQNQLEIIVQCIKKYPLEGTAFVETALQSAPVRLRNNGISVLESWVSAKKTPLNILLPDMYALVCRLRDIEIREDVKQAMSRLIDGKVAFEDEQKEEES